MKLGTRTFSSREAKSHKVRQPSPYSHLSVVLPEEALIDGLVSSVNLFSSHC